MSMSQLLLGTLILLCFGGVTAQVLLIIDSNRRKRRWNERHVLAKVTDVQVEANNLSSYWYVIAIWSDVQTGQTYTFRSRSLAVRPQQRVGDTVIVRIDPNDPHRSSMQL